MLEMFKKRPEPEAAKAEEVPLGASTEPDSVRGDE
jgi:hypothetical protein